jgi:hypothetical protein
MKNQFTKGPVAADSFGYVVSENGQKLIADFALSDNTQSESAANASLFSASINTATALASAGYDAEETLRRLPEILEQLESAKQEIYRLKGVAFTGSRIPRGNDKDIAKADKVAGTCAALLTACKGQEVAG